LNSALAIYDKTKEMLSYCQKNFCWQRQTSDVIAVTSHGLL